MAVLESPTSANKADVLADGQLVTVLSTPLPHGVYQSTVSGLMSTAGTYSAYLINPPGSNVVARIRRLEVGIITPMTAVVLNNLASATIRRSDHVAQTYTNAASASIISPLGDDMPPSVCMFGALALTPLSADTIVAGFTEPVQLSAPAAAQPFLYTRQYEQDERLVLRPGQHLALYTIGMASEARRWDFDLVWEEATT